MEDPLQCVCVSHTHCILTCWLCTYDPCTIQSQENMMMAKVFKAMLPNLSDNHMYIRKRHPFHKVKY